jgi:hypothetical protein
MTIIITSFCNTMNYSNFKFKTFNSIIYILLFVIINHPEYLLSQPSITNNQGYLQYKDGTINYGQVEYFKPFADRYYLLLNNSSKHYVVIGMKFLNDDGYFEIVQKKNSDRVIAVKLVETGKVSLYSESQDKEPEYYSILNDPAKPITYENLLSSFSNIQFKSQHMARYKKFNKFSKRLIQFGTLISFYGLRKYSKQNDPTITTIGAVIMVSGMLPLSLTNGILIKALDEYRNSKY